MLVRGLAGGFAEGFRLDAESGSEFILAEGMSVRAFGGVTACFVLMLFTEPGRGWTIQPTV